MLHKIMTKCSTALIIGTLLFPVTSFATLIDYNVTGNFNVRTGATTSTEYVSGTMTINDAFYRPDYPGFSVAGTFDIMAFSLDVVGDGGSFRFSGGPSTTPSDPGNWNPNSGALEWVPINPYVNETWWYLHNSLDRWDYVYQNVAFFDSNMNQFDPTTPEHFGELAPIISLPGPTYASQFVNAGSYPGGGTLWLTAVPAPVPEPCTLLLMGGGLGSMAFIRRRRQLS